MTLDAPGSMEQLGAAVCSFHEIRLDRSRLNWDLYVIDGLEDGKVALYDKVHHGIIEGRSFVEVVSHWFAMSPRDKTVRAMWEGVARTPRAPRRVAVGAPPSSAAPKRRRARPTAKRSASAGA